MWALPSTVFFPALALYKPLIIHLQMTVSRHRISGWQATRAVFWDTCTPWELGGTFVLKHRPAHWNLVSRMHFRTWNVRNSPSGNALVGFSDPLMRAISFVERHRRPRMVKVCQSAWDSTPACWLRVVILDVRWRLPQGWTLQGNKWQHLVSWKQNKFSQETPHCKVQANTQVSPNLPNKSGQSNEGNKHRTPHAPRSVHLVLSAKPRLSLNQRSLNWHGLCRKFAVSFQ